MDRRTNMPNLVRTCTFYEISITYFWLLQDHNIFPYSAEYKNRTKSTHTQLSILNLFHYHLNFILTIRRERYSNPKTHVFAIHTLCNYWILYSTYICALQAK